MGLALAGSLALCVAAIAAVHGAGASGPPSVSLSPPGNYQDGQVISVNVGPNGYFAPNARIVILECADPGGLASHLPIDATTCDGNTVQGSTVLVGANGSLSVSAYPVYLLPSPTLGEQSNYKPICDQTNYCVLYVGQDQNNFTAAKTFSAPFLIEPSSGTASTTTPPGNAGSNGSPGTTGTTTAPAPSTSSTGADAAVTVSTSGTLANTGPTSQLWWTAISGTMLFLFGVAGRLVLRGER